jgi:phospholipid/cholesterol/gamma-HCH transport system permease protein
LKRTITVFGEYVLFLGTCLREIFTGGVSLKEILRQVTLIGVNSLPIVLLTALFSGMVLAIQTAYGLNRFGAKNYVGNIVGLALIRELGPVLTAVMVCGRVGAGIAAEISSMVVTEQVDALRALGANPLKKLVLPRLAAGIIALPLLVILADAMGIYGGLLIAVYELDLSSFTYWRSYLYAVRINDILEGLFKSAVFGLLVISIACFKGLRVRGGTEGVGRTTTEAVVTGSLVVFISDFFLTKLLIFLFH